VGPVLPAQAPGGKGGPARPRAEQLQGCPKGAPLCDTEDNGSCLRPWGTHTGQGGPDPRPGGLVEERDAAQRHGARAPRGGLDVLEGEERVTPCFLRPMISNSINIVPMTIMSMPASGGTHVHVCETLR
jgi:hypothetical protein